MNEGQQLPQQSQASLQAGQATAKNPSRVDGMKTRLQHLVARVQSAAEAAWGINNRLRGTMPPADPTVSAQVKEEPDGFLNYLDQDLDTLERILDGLEESLKETHGLL